MAAGNRTAPVVASAAARVSLSTKHPAANFTDAQTIGIKRLDYFCFINFHNSKPFLESLFPLLGLTEKTLLGLTEKYKLFKITYLNSDSILKLGYSKSYKTSSIKSGIS